MALPWIRSLIKPETKCRLKGGIPAYDESGNFAKCIIDSEDKDNPTDPPETDDDDGNKNPPKVEKDKDDTDNENPVPDSPRLPTPQPPPVRNPDPRDNPERIPLPVPVPQPRTTLPKIPRRRLPSLERPESDDALLVFQDPVIGVEESAFERTYGCLLHNPITSSPVVFRQCESQQEDTEFSPVEDAQKFFEYLIRKTAQTGVQEGLIAGCVLTLNLLPNRIIRYAPGGQLAFVFGCNLLTNIASDFLFSSSNAYQSIDGNGHINVKYVECTYGYVRFYSTTENIEVGSFGSSPTDRFFDNILTIIDGREVTTTIEGEEVKSSRRYSRRKRNIITGEFTRKKAFLFEWNKGNGKPPLCQTFNLAD